MRDICALCDDNPAPAVEVWLGADGDVALCRRHARERRERTAARRAPRPSAFRRGFDFAAAAACPQERE